jgi:hypothetical protein
MCGDVNGISTLHKIDIFKAFHTAPDFALIIERQFGD